MVERRRQPRACPRRETCLTHGSPLPARSVRVWSAWFAIVVNPEASCSSVDTHSTSLRPCSAASAASPRWSPRWSPTDPRHRLASDGVVRLARHRRLGSLGRRRVPGSTRRTHRSDRGGRRLNHRRPQNGQRSRKDGPQGRIAWRAASAEPLAPAMSRSDTRANRVASICSARSEVASRTASTNQVRKCGSASITPPPTK